MNTHLMLRRTFTTSVGIGLLAALACVTGASAQPPVSEGRLEAYGPAGEEKGMCPLEHTDVRVDIAGFIARVTVVQQFVNPFDEAIEAVYVFPLSERGAVDQMTMKVGDRTIRGIIKEREEARRIYEAARNAGQTASLLDQERPNIFTQSVANILPGENVAITIAYVEYLKYEENRYEFAFPMVVGPRYIPGVPTGAGTDQVPDAERITPPVTPEGTRAGHDIALEVHVDAGLPVRDIQSELHTVDTERPSDTTAVVRLRNQREIPNRDFVLHYNVGAETIGDAVLTHVGAHGGFFSLILQPPARVTPESVTPKELIFVIDSSGSMQGFPIEKAKKTMRQCIEDMNPSDTFNLVSFAGGVGYCFERPVLNTSENRGKALAYLEQLEGGGGTEMMGAIRAALGGQDDPERLRIVCFMTDGFIGNDMAILDAIQKHAGTARVFAFGIGNGVNRFLIEGMARTGRGAAEVVTLESDGDAAAQRFQERVQSPILTDITLDFGGLAVEDIYPDPDAMPDLFAAQPLVLTGRYSGSGEGTVTIRGNTAQGSFERAIPVALPGEAPEHDVLAPLWARARVASLMDQDWRGAQEGKPDPHIKDTITQLGLDFGLVTQYTSFVAVEERVVNENGRPKTVQVPVEMTDGVSYEGVFGRDINGNAPVQALGYLGKGAPAAGRQFAGTPSPFLHRQTLSAECAADQAVPVPSPPRAPKPAPGLVEEAERHDEAKVVDNEILAKIDSALRNLEAKLVNGHYKRGDVEVKDGKVKVFIFVTSAEAEAKLRQAGVHVVAMTQSSLRVLAEVAVTDLEAVAALDCVTRITPPTL